MADPRAHARDIAREAIARGDATGWFEQLYRESESEGFTISWVDLAPNPYLVEWLRGRPVTPQGRAVVVGCGYGDDAEFLAALGLQVTAFDVSQTAVNHCRRRFPESRVDYVTGDALNPSTDWIGAFDLVFEAYTVQVLPGEARAGCASSIGSLVAPGGVLLAIARSRLADEPEGLMPWPLTRAELDDFAAPGLELTNLAEIIEPGNPPVSRFIAEFRRALGQLPGA